MDHLYHWLHPVHDGKVDEVLVHKAPYFFWPLTYESHVPVFWYARAVIFFAIWAFLAQWFFRKSVAQDATGDPRLTRQMEKFAPPAFILFGVSLAFGGMDWVMSLEAHWFSTMFPVYVFAASCCGYFALQILLMNFVQRNGRLTTEITAEHYQDAGKLLFAFGIVFWAYIGFSQYMLIWYANIPEETTWYMARQMGGWGWVSVLLILGHFLGPFLLLISRHPKRRPVFLSVGAAWMLLMHWWTCTGWSCRRCLRPSPNTRVTAPSRRTSWRTRAWARRIRISIPPWMSASAFICSTSPASSGSLGCWCLAPPGG
jgi:hypothetical protein